MYHRNRRKMITLIVCGLVSLAIALPRANDTIANDNNNGFDDGLDNNLIDFDEDYAVKFNKNYGGVPWNSNDNYKESNRYTVVKDDNLNDQGTNVNRNDNKSDKINVTHDEKDKTVENTTLTAIDANITEKQSLETTTNLPEDSSVPLELMSTTVDPLVSLIESTNIPDLSVIPLTTEKQTFPEIIIKETVTLPPSTELPEIAIDELGFKTDDLSSKTADINNEPSTFQSATAHKVFIGAVENTTEKGVSLETTTDVVTSIADSEDSTYIPDKLQIEDRILNNTGISASVNKNKELIENNKKMESVTLKTHSTITDYEKNNETIVLKPESKTDNCTEVFVKQSSENPNDTTHLISTTEIPITKSGSPRPKTKNASTENSNNKNTNITTIEGIKTDKTNTTDDSTEDPDSIPIFTGLDTEEEIEVPEDYYDSKDVLPTSAPKTDALSVIFGLAGSMVESMVENVAERVVPKGIFDLFKRMQKQNEALEAERLRSREENGGLGQFGRGLLKSISTGLSRPLTQLMAGAKDIGSLDTDRGFVASVTSSLTRGVTSGVTTVANAATGLAEAFKDRVQAIYPGTVWCGDGHAASARSGELGLFFFTDTCCRQHDACKIYIRAGETKYGLTNTGLFTRSHCGCDVKFRECLRRTNSLVSAQIGLTYFNVLGPQCFRKAHPITRCIRRTRITGQKCEEYELDYTKPRMWQWFDNETF